MNGFELVMRECNGHERRKGRFMQELFPGRETRLDLSGRAWDVGSICDSAARLANPILNPAKTSGRCLVTVNARHEFFVQLSGKPYAKGKFLEARDSVLKSNYVIAAFANRPAKLLDLHWLFQGQLFVQRPDPANPYAI